jgi:hypothetical protein
MKRSITTIPISVGVYKQVAEAAEFLGAKLYEVLDAALDGINERDVKYDNSLLRKIEQRRQVRREKIVGVQQQKRAVRLRRGASRRPRAIRRVEARRVRG